jgi:acyl-CoA thioesterase FadM
VNLWLRLLHLMLASLFRARLDPVRDASRLDFRVWPTDLDLSFHMNNGRYLTVMDLGRADLMLRSGLWRAALKYRWAPVVNAAKIRFRRELKLFQSFRLETRIVAWGETDVVMEHRLLGRRRTGEEVLSANALARTGLYDRKAKAFVAVACMFAEAGVTGVSAPAPTPEVAAFLEAEEALKQAA